MCSFINYGYVQDDIHYTQVLLLNVNPVHLQIRSLDIEHAFNIYLDESEKLRKTYFIHDFYM